MNPIILPQAMGKLLGSLGSLDLVRQPVKEKENSELTLNSAEKLVLCRILLVYRGW